MMSLMVYVWHNFRCLAKRLATHHSFNKTPVFSRYFLGSDNFSQIYESLKVNEFDVDAAVGEISLEAAKQTAAKARSTLGSSSPTPSKNGGKSGKKNRRRRGAIGEGDPQECGSVTQKLQTLTI